MTAPATLLDAATDVAPQLVDRLLSEGDPGYDEARRIHNGIIDKRPALIARCHGAADLVDAVRLARETGLELSVRGGGHNVAGRAVTEGGLMIDLSAMKGIHVDPDGRVARAQGGVNWGEFNRETQLHGLATTGGVVSTTGIGGLTLGGGIGWLMAKHGLALDNLHSVELVTAAGAVLNVSDDENPDLFWALRGGGGNFGIAASFEYRLHPVGPLITGGLIARSFEAAGDTLRFFRDAIQSLPDDLMLIAAMVPSPDGSGEALAAIALCHCGPDGESNATVRAVKRFGASGLDAIGPMPYTEINAMLDESVPRGALNYWKSSFLSGLSDDAIDAMLDCYARSPSPMNQLVLEHFHGAATRIPVEATAFPHRTEGLNFLILGQWTDPAQTEACIAWTRETYATMTPFFTDGRYVNYLDDDEEGYGDPVAAAYGANYPRLRQLKGEYDPENLFHLNQNIRPAD